MFRKGIIVIVILLFPVLCLSQASREKKALKFIRQQRYNSAYVMLKKLLARDSLNVGAQYVLARYYAVPQNADFHLDSAYRYTQRAFDTWNSLVEKQRRKWRNLPLTEGNIIDLRENIEATAFDQARSGHSEEAYNKFLTNYPLAKERSTAIEERNEVAFSAAQNVNTHLAFLEYIKKYPDSRFIKEAHAEYDRLLFEEGTREKTLLSYKAYLVANPHSPFAAEAEKNVFEIMTADGSAESFIKFLNENPKSQFSRRAASILQHILEEDHHEDQYPVLFESDSVRNLESTASRFLVPFMEKGKFGLMDQDGKQVIAPMYEDLSTEYLCGNITEELIVLPGQVISKNGATLYNGNVISLDDLGYGYSTIEEENGKMVIHNTGFLINEKNLQEAKLIQGRMLAAKKNNLWGLFTLAGRKLIDYECQDISAIGNVLILQVNDKYSLSTLTSAGSIANGEKGRFTEAFDDVRKMWSDKIWVRHGKFEGVLNQNLQVLIKMDTHQISPAYFGAVGTSSQGFSTFNEFGEESEYFEKLQVINPWVAAKTKGGWILYDPLQKISKSILYDSIAIHGPFAIGLKDDVMEIHLHQSNTFITVPVADRVELLPGQDSVSFLLLEKNKKMNVYDPTGQKLFTVTHDKIQSIGAGYFVVSKKEKKGLIDSKGKLILPIEYDAIGTASNGVISILKAMKFGLYDYKKKKLIKPEYDKNITAYSLDVFSVFKNGLSGFVDINNKVLGKIEYNEIQHWTDSIALVKINGLWQLYNIFNRSPVMERITGFTTIRNTPSEKLFIFRQENFSGVISSRKGTVVPVAFSDIVNVGSDELPLYFTEKHVQEASIFVVIYYNHEGAFLRKEVFEQDDYERIYCNKNQVH